MIKKWTSFNENRTPDDITIDDRVKSICDHLEKIRSNFVEFEDSESVTSYVFKVVSVDNIYDMGTYRLSDDIRQRNWESWINRLSDSFKSTLKNIEQVSYFKLHQKTPFCLVIYIKIPVTNIIPGRSVVSNYPDLVGDDGLVFLEDIMVAINRLKDDYDDVLLGLKNEKYTTASVHVYFNS